MLEFCRLDITDPPSLAGFDAVVHFAAESHVDRSILDASTFLRTNVIGTYEMLRVAKLGKVKRFVHVSTDEVYGSLGAKDKPFSEFSQLAPNNPYAASKASSDLVVRSFIKTHDLPALITRCSNNYGPFQFPEKLVPVVITKALRDEKIPVYGNGSNVRDWIHVKDHCEGILAALERGKDGEVYNFGGDQEITNLDLVKTILYLCHKGNDLITFVEDRLGHDFRYAMDHKKATRDLGWKPKRTLASGMMETVAWYVSNPNWLEGIRSKSYMADNEHWRDYFA